MEQPLVSVIIPCYNQSHFLADAVESCVAQTWSELEIIVVDDGSTDRFVEVVQSLEAKGYQLRVIRQPNAGLACARNAGIALARGKYVQFLDSDDYLHPDKFTAQVEHLEANPEFACVYCDFTAVDTNKKTLPHHWQVQGSRPFLSGNLLLNLMINGYFPPVCPLVRKETIDRCGGFTPDLGGHADYEFWMRIAANGLSTAYLDQRLAYYRIYPTSMSKNVRHMHESKVAALKKMAQEYPEALAHGMAAVQEYILCLVEYGALLQTEVATQEATDKKLLDKLSRENERLKQLLAEAKTAVPA